MAVWFQGGMKAVVWTDVFQCGIMVAGILAVCILVGGTYSVTLFNKDKKQTNVITDTTTTKSV